MCIGEYRGPQSLPVFLRYARARSRRYVEEKAFRVYVTEALRLNPQGKCITVPWLDVIGPQKRQESAQEIINGLVERGCLVVVTDEPA